jgi:Family of unknown function (DUF5946)
MSGVSVCRGCGVSLPDVKGPTHAYLHSSPACWALYGEVLAREYSNPARFVVHQLTVDSGRETAYMQLCPTLLSPSD